MGKTIRVLFFAAARELAGTDKTRITLDPDATTAELRIAIAFQYPALGDTISTITLALNQEYLEEESPLRDGDEVALIPPISGG